MAPSEFRGDPAAIRQRGVRIGQLAGGMKGDVAGQRDRLTVGPGTNLGWAMTAPAATISAEWQGYLTSLAGFVEAMGTKLVASADGYADADAESAHEVLSAGRRFE